MMDILQPEGWARPRGYSNGVAASGRTVSVSGMIGFEFFADRAQDRIGLVRLALHFFLERGIFLELRACVLAGREGVEHTGLHG